MLSYDKAKIDDLVLSLQKRGELIPKTHPDLTVGESLADVLMHLVAGDRNSLGQLISISRKRGQQNVQMHGSLLHTLELLNLEINKLERQDRGLRTMVSKLSSEVASGFFDFPAVYCSPNFKLVTSLLHYKFRYYLQGTILFLKKQGIVGPMTLDELQKAILSKSQAIKDNNTTEFTQGCEIIQRKMGLKVEFYNAPTLNGEIFMAMPPGSGVEWFTNQGHVMNKVADGMPILATVLLDDPPYVDEDFYNCEPMTNYSNNDISIALGITSAIFKIASLIIPEAELLGVGLSSISDGFSTAGRFAEKIKSYGNTLSKNHPPYGRIDHVNWTDDTDTFALSHLAKFVEVNGIDFRPLGSVINDSALHYSLYDMTDKLRQSSIYKEENFVTGLAPWSDEIAVNRVANDIFAATGSSFQTTVDATCRMEVGDIPFKVSRCATMIPFAPSLGSNGLWNNQLQYSVNLHFSPGMRNHKGERFDTPYNLMVVEGIPVALAPNYEFIPGVILTRPNAMVFYE
jgi:hypothetical protein